MNFSYILPTKVVFGFGSLAGLDAEAKTLKAKNVLIVTDKVMVKTGAVQKVVSGMGGVSTSETLELKEPRTGSTGARAHAVGQ